MSADTGNPIGDKTPSLSRRDLGRYAAASAVAAAMCAKAAGQEPDAKSGGRMLAQTQTKGCRIFMSLLPANFTIGQLLYGDFVTLVDALSGAANTNGNTDLKDGLDALANQLRRVDNGRNLAARHLFAFDPHTPPPDPNDTTRTLWGKGHWSSVYAACTSTVITEQFRFPFLDLPNNEAADADPGHREYIRDLLEEKIQGTETFVFQDALGAIAYQRLFSESREQVCGTLIANPPSTNVPWKKYRLIRSAFHHGVFGSMSMGAGHNFESKEMKIIPNNKCYSESLRTCKPMYGAFCEIYNGGPSASTTTCA